MEHDEEITSCHLQLTLTSS